MAAQQYTMSMPNGSLPTDNMNSSPFKSSFPDPVQPAGLAAFPFDDKPQIYTAVYSGVNVYEFEVKGVACMRRRADGWLNATQILKVAGVEKGKRTKVLEKEVLAGEHEKVQGGYGKYQGTWISYARGREFCRQYGVEDLLRPLLEYDMPPDGHVGPSQQPKDTPTKEQAMALNKKRFNSAAAAAQDARNKQMLNQGTFFSNISPMTTVALDAMNKAAQGQPQHVMRNAYMSANGQHAANNNNNVQGIQADRGCFADQMALGTPSADAHERPRKRMRQSEDMTMTQMSIPMDASMYSVTTTEPNSNSFVFQADQELPADLDNPFMLPPLPKNESDIAAEKQSLLLNLFVDPGRVDYSDHPAMTQLSPNDYSMPIDNSANTALHWAATLGRVPLLRLLLSKGANMWRGNAAGQSALVSCVLAANCSDRFCFPEMLELLGPLIEARDASARTILHHIAVACGIKQRAASSKYYLEALLEFLVRSAGSGGQSQAPDSQQFGMAARGPPSLMRFLSAIVNARDRGGNTALNLVARIGNRSIIQQLLEIKADPAIANNKGVSAYDFGIGNKDGLAKTASFMAGQNDVVDAAGDATPRPRHNASTALLLDIADDIENQNSDVIASLTSMLGQNLDQHKALLSTKNAEIDQLNQQIRELSIKQKAELERFQVLQRKAEQRADRRKRIENLRRIIADSSQSNSLSDPAALSVGADEVASQQVDFSSLITNSAFDPSHLPPLAVLKQHLRVYAANNRSLAQRSADLESRSLTLEAQYRRVVALCTGVEEGRVDSVLPSLVAAVESERSVAGFGPGTVSVSGAANGHGHAHEHARGSFLQTDDVSMLDDGNDVGTAGAAGKQGTGTANATALATPATILAQQYDHSGGGGGAAAQHNDINGVNANGVVGMFRGNETHHTSTQSHQHVLHGGHGMAPFPGRIIDAAGMAAGRNGPGRAADGDASGHTALNVGRVRNFLAMVEGVHGIGGNDLMGPDSPSGGGGFGVGVVGLSNDPDVGTNTGSGTAAIETGAGTRTGDLENGTRVRGGGGGITSMQISC